MALEKDLFFRLLANDKRYPIRTLFRYAFFIRFILLPQTRRGHFREGEGVNKHEEDYCNHSISGCCRGFCFCRMPEAGGPEARSSASVGNDSDSSHVDADSDGAHGRA